jgi:hypothetical protein
MAIKINGTNTTASPGITGPDTDTGLVYGDDDVKIVTGGTERVTVNNTGMGINTSSPAYKLDVASAVIQFGDSTDAFAQYKSSAGNWHVGANSSNAFAFNTGTYGSGSERLRIDSSGNVGIGVADPGSWNANYNGPRAVIGSTSNSACGLVLLSSTAGSSRLDFSDGTGGFGQAPGSFVYNHSSNSLAFATDNSERARIDSSGRLLVGTSTGYGFTTAVFAGNGAGDGPTGPGTIALSRGIAASSLSSGNALGHINFTANAGEKFASINGLGDGTAGSGDYPGRLVFSTTADGASSPTERMRIDSTGRIGINTNVVYDINNASLAVAAAWPRTPIEVQSNTSTGHYAITFRNANGLVGNILTNTSSTFFNTSSDYRLKENVVDIVDGITRVKQLQPKRFNFITDADTIADGFLAHEAAEVVPECVTGEKDEVDDDGNPVYQGIDQSKLVPLLTAALQEAITKIETLETQNASLEARLTALEGGAS